MKNCLLPSIEHGRLAQYGQARSLTSFPEGNLQVGGPDLRIQATPWWSPYGGHYGIVEMHYGIPLIRAITDTQSVAEPPPVLRVDMLGNQVTASSMWDVWTAGVAVNTLCVQNGREGRAVGIGEWSS